MAERKVSRIEDAPSRRKPATTPEERENQLISLAFDLVEERLRAGTATSQETTHFLKRGSTREKLEEEKLVMDNQLTSAKIENLASQQRVEELYAEAMAAMSSYQGRSIETEDDYVD